VGYSWLLQVGTGQGGYTWLGRFTAILYGLGAALTLDEYALWLNLRDVYWEREGEAGPAFMPSSSLAGCFLWASGVGHFCAP
jgi:hypothetical protein